MSPQQHKKTRDERPRAAALAYDPAIHQAPMVVAKGMGEVARRIVELAREHGIPLHRDPDLVEILAALDVPSAIPPETYQVVAEVLAFLYHANRTAPR